MLLDQFLLYQSSGNLAPNAPPIMEPPAEMAWRLIVWEIRHQGIKTIANGYEKSTLESTGSTRVWQRSWGRWNELEGIADQLVNP